MPNKTKHLASHSPFSNFFRNASKKTREALFNVVNDKATYRQQVVHAARLTAHLVETDLIREKDQHLKLSKELDAFLEKIPEEVRWNVVRDAAPLVAKILRGEVI
jgi:hypothetical protein